MDLHLIVVGLFLLRDPLTPLFEASPTQKKKKPGLQLFYPICYAISNIEFGVMRWLIIHN